MSAQHSLPTNLARPLASTTCLVTGGLGFIGSNLVHALVAAGAQVRVVDALVPQHGGDLRNLEGLELPLLLCDVGDERVADLVAGVDIVFNVAGQVSHHASMIDPLRDLDLNVRSQLGFLELVRRVNPSTRIVLTSTRQVYGRPDHVPVDETHPTRPVDVNGIDKLACEQLHLLYARVHGSATSVLRLTNVYGPRQNLVKDDLGALPVFIRKAMLGHQLSLYGSGEQRRDCLHVDDVVRALAAAASIDAAAGQVINIGHVRSWTLREITASIAAAVLRAGGPCSPIEFTGWPNGLQQIDIGDFETDSSLAGRVLDWRAEIDLDAGLDDTIAFYLEHPWYLSST
jgi:UDP-glucose 4-epimerase